LRIAATHLTFPREGETENGDAVLVRRTASGGLVAVIDALGHGAPAAEVAIAAVEHLTGAPLDIGVQRLADGLHARLRNTRGAAVMLCLFDGASMEGCGVGNVELRALTGRVPAVLTPGVVGSSMNRLKVFHADLAPGDRFLFFSDGISGRIDSASLRGLTAAEVCREIMEKHRRHHDDSTVLVADLEA
jgi:phosphoserine phosphatase RsbX